MGESKNENDNIMYKALKKEKEKIKKLKYDILNGIRNRIKVTSGERPLLAWLGFKPKYSGLAVNDPELIKLLIKYYNFSESEINGFRLSSGEENYIFAFKDLFKRGVKPKEIVEILSLKID